MLSRFHQCCVFVFLFSSSQLASAQSVLPEGVSAGIGFENGGTYSVGPYKLRSFVQFDDQFKTGEMIRIDGTATPDFEELLSIGLQYEQPLWQNWRLRINASTSETKPSREIADFFDQTSRDYGLGGTVLGTTLSYTHRPTDDFVAVFSGGFQSRDVKTKKVPIRLGPFAIDPFAGLGELQGESFSQRTRDVQASVAMNYNLSNDTGLYSAFGLDIGVDWFSPRHVRDGVDDTPLVLHYAGQLTQNLPQSFQIVLKGHAQWSDERLNQQKMFGIGGWDYATAYDPGEEVGDIGAGARLELNKVGVADLGGNLKLYYQPALFVDFGATKINSPIDDEARGVQTKASVGAGISLELTNGLHAGVQVAYPIADAANLDFGDKEPRWLFSVGIKQ